MGISDVHGVRYQVTDVARAAAFYTEHLGFTLGVQVLPAFASVSLGGLMLLLSGPGASGSRAMPDGQLQRPGGWNRLVLRVTDLPAQIETLKAAGVRFRNQIESGPGGRQIQIEDPDGNPIELFEPARQIVASSAWRRTLTDGELANSLRRAGEKGTTAFFCEKRGQPGCAKAVTVP